MSLFRCRQWWQAQCGESEEFDIHSLCCGNVDNSASGETKVVVGSLQGLLRVYSAQQTGYRLEHLMHEVRLFQISGCLRARHLPSSMSLTQGDLGAPILALEVGVFGADRKQTLAVLHPRKVSVFSLSAQAWHCFILSFQLVFFASC